MKFTPSKILLFLLVIFNVVFPKGGIKIEGIPLTWGYVLIFLSALLFFLIGLPRLFSTSLSRWKLVLFILPFQLYCIVIFINWGFVDFGWFMSFCLNVIIFPILFIIVFAYPINRLDLSYLYNLIRHSIVIVAAYGIVLFFYRIVSNSWIEIPYLTINADDYQQLDLKHIDRGEGIFKLISTFNNGNIYGVSILLLLPLYDLIEWKNWKKILVKVSLLLTLSRTVWIGLLLYELIFKLYINKITPTKLIKIILISLLSICCVFIIAFALFGGSNFLFDRDLGGRLNQFISISDLHWLGSKKFEGVAEIVYMSILNQFGIIGLLLFIIAMSAPILISLKTQDTYKRSIVSALSIYLIISVSDGAFLFIPVLVYFWFLSSLSQREVLTPDNTA